MYEFPLPAAVKPLQLTYVKCNITDAETKLPLPARYEIVNAAIGKIVKWANADKTDGSFLTPLSSGVNYSLNITHPGYLFYSDSFECATNRCEDGAYRWVAVRGKAMERNAAGMALRMTGTVRDVHDRHRAVEREKRQAQELAHAGPAHPCG